MSPRKRDDEETSRPLTMPDPEMTRERLERLGDKRLLEMAIQATPDPLAPGRGIHIPATRFATDYAYVNDRTVRRYLAGDRPVPPLLREKCIEIVLEAVKKAARKAKR